MDTDIAAVCVEHGIPHLSESICEALANEPFLGSSLDVMEALDGLVDGESKFEASSFLAAALLSAYSGAKSGRKRQKIRPAPKGGSDHMSSTSSSSSSALEQLSWKREYKSEHDRFKRPYVHNLGSLSLVLQQAPFNPEGFASTVWDSSIVLAKYFEKEAARYVGLRCIELGAGCGLPGIVLSALGADVTLTDLDVNIPLLESNVEANRGMALVEPPVTAARVTALRWGEDIPSALHLPFDLVVATDVLYSHEAVAPLVKTLWQLTGAASACHQGRCVMPQVILAAGRNRHAADEFFSLISTLFDVVNVPTGDLDPQYSCEDVSVWKLQPRRCP